MDATGQRRVAIDADDGAPASGAANSAIGVSASGSAAVELAQLRIRVIALENLVITLLAEVSDQQRDLARRMALYISPRPGFTRHRPTTHAAAQMRHLVERADHFGRAATPAIA
jgi:hypothetical protein